MIKNIKYFLVFIALICSQYAYSEFDTAYARVLQNRIEYLKNLHGLVGISAAAEVPGQGIWLGTAGISHVNVSMDTNMVFDIGSITKNFVAALTLQLVEADSLSLEDSIGTWLAQYPNINNKVTVRQLLNHTSGFYNFTDNPSWQNAVNSNPYRLWDIEEVVQGYILSPYFAPGAGWHYSNTNYTLLTMIIRKITGSDLGPLFRERFYIPLGMNSAFVEIADTITAPFAHNWVQSGGNLVDAYGYPRIAFASSAYGPGGVITRPENMLRWLKALYGGQIISQPVLNQMLTFVNANISGANGYGLGTMRYNVNNRTCWGHAGNSFGHSSVAMHYAPGGITIAVMMNKDLVTGPVGIDFMNTVITYNPTGISQISGEVPQKFSLSQNYPNPFNPKTNFEFKIAETGSVKLEIFDAAGRLIETIVDKEFKPGIYKAEWNAAQKPSGVYFYRLNTGNFTETRKMILVK